MAMLREIVRIIGNQSHTLTAFGSWLLEGRTKAVEDDRSNV
jgi:hypothetical protein